MVAASTKRAVSKLLPTSLFIKAIVMIDYSTLNSQNDPSEAAKFIYLPEINLTPPPTTSSAEREILTTPSPMSDSQANPAQIYLEQAQAFWQEQKWQLVIQAAQKALKIDSQLAEAHKLIGNALQKLGKITEAMGYYARSIEIQPDFAEAYANLGTIYAQQKNWDKAIVYYQQALSTDPNLPGVYRNLAKIWEQKQEKEKAKSCLAKSRQLESQPDALPSVQNYVNRGKQLQKQGNLAVAREQYLQAIKLETNHLESYEHLLDIAEELQQWQEAVQYCKIIVQINSPQIKSKLPQIRHNISSQPPKPLKLAPGVQKAKISPTIAKFIEKARANPNSAQIQGNLGILYAKEQQWQQAIAHFQKAIAINPNLPVAYRNLARVFQKIGQPQTAQKYWSKAVALDGNLAQAEEHLKLGKNLASWGKNRSALNCYRRAIQLKPDLIEAYLKLAELLTKANQKQQAVLCYQQGIKYNPENAELYHQLGLAYHEQHQWLAATDCYQKVIQWQPQNAEVYHLLAEVLTRQEKWEAASVAYQKAIALESEDSC